MVICLIFEGYLLDLLEFSHACPEYPYQSYMKCYATSCVSLYASSMYVIKSLQELVKILNSIARYLVILKAKYRLLPASFLTKIGTHLLTDNDLTID